MKCLRCEQEIPSSAKFCPECGTLTAQIHPGIRDATDTQLTLDAIAKTAARLCEAKDAIVESLSHERGRRLMNLDASGQNRPATRTCKPTRGPTSS